MKKKPTDYNISKKHLVYAAVAAGAALLVYVYYSQVAASTATHSHGSITHSHPGGFLPHQSH